MEIILAVAIGSIVVTAVFTWLFTSRRYNRSIQGYNSIQDAIEDAKKQHASVQEARDAAASSLNDHRRELQEVTERTKELVTLESRAKEIHLLLTKGKDRIAVLKERVDSGKEESEKIRLEIHQLRSELDLYTRLMDFVDFGIYEEPEYLHEMSDRYKVEIDKVRAQQKELISQKKAIEIPNDIEVDGTSKKGKAVLEGQARLMLRAFNNESDLLIGKVKPSNYARTLERIEKVADNIEKSSISLRCGIAPEYVELKYRECTLCYEYRLKKQVEDEEQRLIREQMREEQRALQEYQREIDAAEREERMYEDLLQRAQKELEFADSNARTELEAKIALLEKQLQEAQEKEARAKSLAEQTRRGHVYIISNIGSFGENVYKIGMTRRLDPMDRVKELGDASVPFSFDVHAIVFSDDAPAMETELHRRFAHRRVNAVNHRKEFFRVSLDEIESAVNGHCGKEVDFHVTALAEEYHESLRLLGNDTDGTTVETSTP